MDSNNTSKELLKSLNFCVIDLETTGGNHENDQIIEVGLVRIRELQIEKSVNFLVNPQKTIPEFIQKLTSIKQEDVENCPPISDVIEDILDFIGDDIIVAHNTSFDVPFLNSVLRRLGIKELENKVICTNVMTKHMIPEIMTSNLNYMSQLFNIEHDNAHRAKDDAIATAKLLLKFLEIFESKGIKKVNQLYYPRNKFELDRIHFQNDIPKKEILDLIKSHPHGPMLLSFKGERGLIVGVLPVEDPLSELDFIQDLVENLPWQILTIRLICPLLEGFFQFNNHLQKYPLEYKNKILDYLNNRYSPNGAKKQNLEEMDFLIGHHLVKSQVTVFNFLNLNTNAKHLFKIPAQKKKMLNFINGQINRFKNNQKKQRRTLLHTELIPIIECYLANKLDGSDFLPLSISELKKDESKTLKKIEDFSYTRSAAFRFPQDHL